jgi:membrane fusion protein (multidrug efflux system)
MSTLARRIRQLPRRAWIVFTAALIAIVLGVAWLTSPPTQVSTDNAYLKADISYVAPRVHGLVAAILVKDNQTVAVGQPLIRLDDTEYVSRVRSAEADVAQAEAAVAAAKAALDRSDAEESLARASSTEAQTAIASAESERDRANSDRTRYAALAGQGWVPKQKLESVSTTAVTASSNLDKARAAALVALSQVNVVVRRRAELEAAIKNADATLARAKATLALAKQDEGDTVIRSPIAGVVGDRQIEAGEFVQPGTRLMAIVRSDALYVVANFKETQTERMLAGEAAEIYVDALPNDVIRGTVESLSPASGSEFALLPFEPGTGNFTKIVQRVPVRIKLTPGQATLARLRPGLSVSATVVLDARAQDSQVASR